MTLSEKVFRSSDGWKVEIRLLKKPLVELALPSAEAGWRVCTYPSAVRTLPGALSVNKPRGLLWKRGHCLLIIGHY
jgi:hypothetical protein